MRIMSCKLLQVCEANAHRLKRFPLYSWRWHSCHRVYSEMNPACDHMPANTRCAKKGRPSPINNRPRSYQGSVLSLPITVTCCIPLGCLMQMLAVPNECGHLTSQEWLGNSEHIGRGPIRAAGCLMTVYLGSWASIGRTGQHQGDDTAIPAQVRHCAWQPQDASANLVQPP